MEPSAQTSTGTVPTRHHLGLAAGAMRVFDLSLGQMLWSRRTIFMALVVGLPVVVAAVLRALPAFGIPVVEAGVTGPLIFGLMFWGFFVRFAVPVLAMFYGTALVADEVDLVVEAPADPAETIRNDEHATIAVYHTTLDPFDRAFINVAAQSAVDEVNRVVLAEVADTAQERSADYEEALPAARESMGHMADALRRGDETEARAAQADAIDSLTIVEQQLGLSSDVVEGLERTGGTESDSVGSQVGAERDEIEALDTTDPEAADRAEQIEAELAELETALTEFRSISPRVLVRPFIAAPELAQGTDIPLTTYYSPGVVAVLLQHVVLTFAALSVVSERSTGSTEMFRVGPVRLWEFVVGKFLGYALIGVVVGAVAGGTMGAVFLARRADGGMRDALSLMDQVLSFADPNPAPPTQLPEFLRRYPPR